MTIIAMILLLAFLVVIWRTKPAVADVTITAIRYTLDDVTWIGLDGATLEPGYINVAVTWQNNSSESVDTLMTLVVEDQGQEPDREYVTVAPNEEVTSALLMEFMEGSRRVTTIIYREETMVVLDTKTVNVSVVEAVKPAEIIASNLVISPIEVFIGEHVDISITVTNIGGERGSHIVQLGGDFMEQKTVVLNPGESKEVAFQVTPDQVRSYEVSVDGLSGSFVALELPTPDIVVSNLVIEPSQVYVGEVVTISVTATNHGNAPGEKMITLQVV